MPLQRPPRLPRRWSAHKHVAPAGPSSLVRLLVFFWLGGGFLVGILFGLYMFSLPGHALSPPDVPAEAPHKQELNWQRKPTDSRKKGKVPVKKQVGMCQGQVQDAHPENIPSRHEVNVRHQGKSKPTGTPLQGL